MDKLKALFAKYMNDSCTTAEIKRLMEHFGQPENENDLKTIIAREMAKDEETESDETALDERMLKIYGQLKPGLNEVLQSGAVIRPMRNYFRYVAAAAVILLVSAALFFYMNPNPGNKSQRLTAQHQGDDVGPGGNKAILTLADGSEISLTDADDGELISQSGITITKTRDGALVYTAGDVKSGAAQQYNTISTPAGGQYQINLPDGSKVWLNAMSSLKYPTVFNETDRKVTLSGEAYFEIAKDQQRPFTVASNGAGNAQEVTVLGTHFNINSYTDEVATRTTLLEGRVKVASGTNSKMIKPGQQSTVSDGIVVAEVDVNQVLDWKNNSFYFADENIRTIMRKLARWYDLNVEYKGKVPDFGFGAEISRTKKLSEVLKALETTGKVHFKIEGRRVTVMP
ncbi:transmembrane sensor [Pedobacter africanus]|uniref:Ferric-dicitrate binding protein FerR (Iron transport regulator) n=1 Tax=Pedobacter africanus TaxID=151894 RepID=A0ACC6KSQ3_9SPHI|nr:FecR domain-containing protein [Pedobacter africanus]MDR6782383.1 ferric-dicitrate binding protein FerR (iron transport regulator) [Pedobacter africanus]